MENSAVIDGIPWGLLQADPRLARVRAHVREDHAVAWLQPFQNLDRIYRYAAESHLHICSVHAVRVDFE